MPSPDAPVASVHPDLAPALEEVRRTRRATLDRVAGLDDATLSARPADDRWSIAEVLDHLVLTDGIYAADLERLYEMAARGERAHLRRGFRDVDASILFIPKSVLPLLEVPFSLFSLAMPKGVRDLLVRSRVLPAQRPSVSAPRPGRRGAELRRDLETGPARLERLFAAHPEVDPRSVTHFHPLLGRNDVAGVLSFIVHHERRHQEQIDGTRREIGAAAGAVNEAGM